MEAYCFDLIAGEACLLMGPRRGNNNASKSDRRTRAVARAKYNELLYERMIFSATKVHDTTMPLNLHLLRFVI